MSDPMRAVVRLSRIASCRTLIHHDAGRVLARKVRRQRVWVQGNMHLALDSEVIPDRFLDRRTCQLSFWLKMLRVGVVHTNYVHILFLPVKVLLLVPELLLKSILYAFFQRLQASYAPARMAAYVSWREHRSAEASCGCRSLYRECPSSPCISEDRS